MAQETKTTLSSQGSNFPGFFFANRQSEIADVETEQMVDYLDNASDLFSSKRFAGAFPHIKCDIAKPWDDHYDHQALVSAWDNYLNVDDEIKITLPATDSIRDELMLGPLAERLVVEEKPVFRFKNEGKEESEYVELGNRLVSKRVATECTQTGFDNDTKDLTIFGTYRAFLPSDYVDDDVKWDLSKLKAKETELVTPRETLKDIFAELSASLQGIEAVPEEEPKFSVAFTAKAKNTRVKTAEIEQAKLEDQKDKYKTALCKRFLKDNHCYLEDKCTFAHGEDELRWMAINFHYKNIQNKAKTCTNFLREGICTRGKKCAFKHELWVQTRPPYPVIFLIAIILILISFFSAFMNAIDVII